MKKRSLIQNLSVIGCDMPTDTEMEAEVEPSLETEQRLAQEEAAKVEAQRKHEQELAAMAEVHIETVSLHKCIHAALAAHLLCFFFSDA